MTIQPAPLHHTPRPPAQTTSTLYTHHTHLKPEKLSSTYTATVAMAKKAKSRTIAVRLISMALTGYYKTLVRPRQHRPLSMLKYDPVGTFARYLFPTTLRHLWVCGERKKEMAKGQDKNRRCERKKRWEEWCWNGKKMQWIEMKEMRANGC
ncbi:hypothetical protein E4T49_03900 [Aureobasidium sp. EXF-10728]|nr:hypothetical protein E4T49_03900 [Aureobasidium sp. EXF-10728]